jgi:glucokinase
MTQQFVVGVDIGGTKIAFALVSPALEVLLTYQRPTPVAEGPEAVFAQVALGVHHLVKQSPGPIAGIGIGCPGHLDPHLGVIHKASNLGWDNVALLDGLRRYLHDNWRLWLQKDVNAAALGEMLTGAAQNCADFVLLMIGTGLGGGAVVAGEIVNGANNTGMDIGHMPLDPHGRICGCGMRGCPEMYVSGVGLLAGASEYLLEYPTSPLALIDDITPQTILAAFRNGDKLSLRLMDELTDWLCSVMIVCMGLLNPGLFVVGGGLGHAAYEHISTQVREKLRRRTRREIHREVPIIESAVQHSAVGPACLAWHKLREA